ncbi:hypothetical protein [Paraburkholderia sp. BR14374]|uniref:hypothetical protein n=1 Tax=Paraburkholderia sp. BR14374 TaxID=3237007 RepID=UPI0034CEF197
MKRVDDIHQCAVARSAIVNSTLYGKALSAYPAIFHLFAGVRLASGESISRAAIFLISESEPSMTKRRRGQMAGS